MDILRDLLEGILSNLRLLNTIGSSGNIVGDIDTFEAAYKICLSIATNVCQPIAYSLLALFGMLDLFHVSLRLQQQGGGSGTPFAVLTTVIKFTVVKWAIDNSTALLSGIFSIAMDITSAISLNGLDLASLAIPLQEQIESSNIGFLDGLGSILFLLLTYLATWIAIIGVNYVIISRFVQVYFYVALSPIPMSFFEEEHTLQMGMSFLKGFASVALQSVVILLALRLFPAFSSALVIDSDTLAMSCLNIAMMSIILLGTVFSSGQVAKAVFGT